MNKRVFNTVLVFTGSVLLGIILFQVLWLNNLASVRKQELKSYTQQALTATVTKLQTKENVSMILNNYTELIPDSVDFAPLSDIKNISSDIENISSDMENISDRIDFQLNMPESDSLHDTENMIHEDHTNLSREIVINSISINKLKDKAKSIESLVHQMIFELDSSPMDQRINPDTLKSILTSELKNRGVQIGFEYAIVEGDSIISKSPEFIETSALMRFETKLFPDDIFDKDMTLVMYYPASSSAGYIFSKMKTFLILTGIFTIGILIAFYLTIRTIKKQKKLGEMKNDFINNITHEFKTPIATSSIAIAALENQQVRSDNERFNYYTGVLKEENHKMNLHVEKVLQLAMMDKGKLETVLQEMNGNEALQNSFKGFNLLLKENNIKADIQLNAAQTQIKADPFHLMNVFNNIIDNAIKYRSESPTLYITSENKNGYWTARFIDNGPGMNNEVLNNAFEAFYRGQKGNLHDVKGFGLGLSYAKNVVESCKGTIHINSTVNKGTEVIITFPLA